jgi:methyltransferase (TIGR00027 family)
MNEPLISNVSDTARWVATYRAVESARPDALFRDPYAARLAGERGRAMASAAKKHMTNGWPIIVRTKNIDDLVLKSIDQGCDLVLCLAAGLDTRPYRLALPEKLRWVEADLPAITEEKEKLLAGEKPHCVLTREKVDLADEAARRAFLDRTLEGATKALVITEGLLVYLPEPVVRALAKDLERPAVRWWMFDIASPAILEMMKKGMGAQLDNAPVVFAPPNGVAYFEALGWNVRDMHSALRDAARYKRLPWFMRPFALFPDADPRNVAKARWSAVVRLERQSR